MATNVVDARIASRLDLKELGASTGPCLTILLPINKTEPNDRRAALELKSALQKAERLMLERGMSEQDVQSMLAPLREMQANPEAWADSGEGIVILRSPDFQRWIASGHPIREEVILAEHFHLLPVLQSLSEHKKFYILALSQKHIRLLRCTNQTSEEVPLPSQVPTNLDEFLQIDPDGEQLDTSFHPGGGTNSFTRSSTIGTTDLEKKDDYLHHFYKAVTRGIHDVLKDDPAPVVPAGVEYEIGIFRRASVLPRVSEHAVFGAPDGLKGGELHARALEAVQPEFEAPLERALDLYEKNGGNDRAAPEPRQVVKAAFEGRVSHLFLAEGGRLMGNFDEAAHRVHMPQKARAGDEDLLNAAAIQTLLHGGEVFVTARERVPQQSDMAALLRW